MKKICLGLIILLSCSEKSKNEELILDKWYMYKIEELSLGKQDVLGSSSGCPFLVFNGDNTFKSFNGIVEHKGNWKLSGSEILLMTKDDTSQLVIQQINKLELEWIVYEHKSRIKFYASTLSPEGCP